MTMASILYVLFIILFSLILFTLFYYFATQNKLQVEWKR